MHAALVRAWVDTADWQGIVCDNCYLQTAQMPSMTLQVSVLNHDWYQVPLAAIGCKLKPWLISTYNY